MRLLLDENLSPTLCGLLADEWPDAVHVHTVGLGSTSDDTVWNYARVNGLTIVSKDSDFRDKAILEGFPPKIIWLRVGNCTTSLIAASLRRAKPDIQAFLDNDGLGVLELF